MALGPNYVYADELATPSEIGVRRDGSFGGIARAVAGVNYYADAIGFGQTSGLAKNEFGAGKKRAFCGPVCSSSKVIRILKLRSTRGERFLYIDLNKKTLRISSL